MHAAFVPAHQPDTADLKFDAKLPAKNVDDLLTPDQVRDLFLRLKSFIKHGILPANKAQATFGSVITSSDSSLKPWVCLNAVNLKKCTDFKEIITNDLCGTINMSIERHNFISCDNFDEFKKQLEQRLFCTFIFIIDLDKIPDKSVAKRASVINYVWTDGIAKGHIPLDAIIGVMIPENLTEIAASFFKPEQIIAVPVYKGNVKLSNFTLGTALNYTGLDKSGIIKDVFVPDYESAFLKFRKQHPELNYCGLHLSRFATQHCLKHPFKIRSAQEASEHFIKQGAIHWRVRECHPTLRECGFSRQSLYTQKDLQAARISLCEWLSNPKPVVLADVVKDELQRLVHK